MNARIEALIQKVERALWLQPTAEDHTATIEALGADFGRALAKIDPEIPVPRVTITRCAEELCAGFLGAWAGASSQRNVWRFQESLRRASASRWLESDDEVRTSQEQLDAALTDSLARSIPVCEASPVKDPPFMRLARAELAWLARDDDEPSPWGPLVDLWALGAWPVWLPAGELRVYLPMAHGGEVDWVPDSPTPRELPAVAGEMLTAFSIEWADWTFRQKDALLTIPRYRVAAAGGDLLAVFDPAWIHPHVFPLTGDEVIVGRIAGNQIVLPRGSVSKRHAALLRSDGRWFVADLQSSGGTAVNRRRIAGEPVLLEPGDRIQLAGLTLRVLQPGEVAVVAGPLMDQSAG